MINDARLWWRCQTAEGAIQSGPGLSGASRTAAFQDYKEGAPPGFSEYHSHYNKELKKCLILINQKSELNGQPVMATELHDAVERR